MKKFTSLIKETMEKHHYVDGILTVDDSILILRRANYMKRFPGKWGFVGGSIEKTDSDSKKAIEREIKEETGIELTFNEKNNMKLFDKFEGDDYDIEYWLIKLETKPEIKISREHSKYEWIDIEKINSHNYNFMPNIFQCIQKVYSDT